MLALLIALLAPAPQPLPVVFHVPQVAGQPSVDPPWLDTRLTEANRVFQPHGVTFRRAGIETLPTNHASADRRDQRDALAPLNRPGVINVYVVNRLLDIHEKGRVRRGVHWKVREAGKPRRTRFVILAAYSGPGVLGHELGHYLGHPRHSDVPDNLMSYTRTGKRPTFLDARQGKLMKRVARRLVRQKLLVP